MFKYLYIDESGDLGLRGSRYLVLAALLVDNPAPLERIIKNMRRNKFRKALRKATEIRANKSSKALIVHMLQNLNTISDAKVFYMILEKRKLFSEYLKNNKHKLYNYVAGKLARQIAFQAIDVEIRIDKSQGKQLLQDDFNHYFLKNLQDRSTIHKAHIHHSYSHAWVGLQFADVLA